MELPKSFKPSKAQKEAFEGLENTSNSYFIFGAAGSGKSTFIEYFRKNTKKNSITLTFTGLAAILTKGQTIHSFFQLEPRLLLKNDDGLKTVNKRLNQIKVLDVLIIDEISTVRCDLLNAIDELLQKYKNNSKPFGGVQVLFVGDFFQISPVEPKGNNEWKAFRNDFDSIWFFDCEGYKNLNPKLIEFTTPHRQYHDSDLQKYLKKIRQNEYDSKTLSYFNSRVQSKEKFPPSAIALCPTNKQVDQYNNKYLNALSSESKTYIGKKSKNFKESEMPTDMELVLKERARIMLISNDSAKRWVNGTFAIITSLNDKKIKIKIPYGKGKYSPEYEVEKELWEKYDYRVKKSKQSENGKVSYEAYVVGSFEQYPIRIARATTIHKSQGQTFEEVIVDFGSGAFTHGQAYVALSRTRNMSGLYLKEKLTQSDIKFDSKVVEYYNKNFEKIFGKPSKQPELFDDLSLTENIEEIVPF